MEIKVTLDRGRLTFSPDPAVVQRGSLVSWSFRAIAEGQGSLRWIVYFGKGSPFRGQDDHFVTDTPPVEGRHVGASREMSADEPGEYKYGVRVVDPASPAPLADDDPWLIVK